MSDVALLGLGPWGRNHLRVLCEMGALRSVWDPDADALSHAPAALRASSLEEVLSDTNVRAVVVATPARTHHALASAAMDAGKDVLVEKPLTLDEGQAADLVSRSRRQGRVLMVGHITLYHPAIVKLRDLVASGALGRMRYLYANRLNLGTVRDEEDILWSFAPHDIAVFLELLDAWPGSLSAHGGNYLKPGRADVTVTHLEFPDGVRGHIFVSWLHPVKEHRLVVIGDRRMATFTDGPDGGRLVLCEGVPPERGAAPPDPATAVDVPVASSEPLRCELEHFLDCVRSREEPLTGGQHGLAVLRVLESARRSLRQAGGRVVVPMLEAHA
ncbi:MAG: Gfo/Idh/MocA family oxidoreductase [Planctomycetota bacterium]|nr:Gfo/Idh/MocA family oxidoreductase [Planctomycetota bacterium]